MNKTINTVKFAPDQLTAVVKDLIYQWDQNQYLAIEGLNLEPYVQVQFKLDSLQNTVDGIGFTKDGITEVQIPAHVFQKATLSNYKVKAYIYSGNETTHEILMNITARPKPEDYSEPIEQTAFAQAIDKLNEASNIVLSKADGVYEQAAKVDQDTQTVTTLKGQVETAAAQVVKDKNQVATDKTQISKDVVKVDTDTKAVAADKIQITEMKNSVDAIYQKHLDYGLKRLIFSDTEPEGDPREIIWVDTSDNTGL